MTDNLVNARSNPNPNKGFEERTRANGITNDGRYPYRCACCPTSCDSGCCSASSCRLAACDGHCSPASSRSATIASNRIATSLPTWPPVVSRLRGRGSTFSASTPTARPKVSPLLPMRRGGSLRLSLPSSLPSAALVAPTSRETTHGPPRGQVLELPAAESSQGSPQGHLNFQGVT